MKTRIFGKKYVEKHILMSGLATLYNPEAGESKKIFIQKPCIGTDVIELYKEMFTIDSDICHNINTPCSNASRRVSPTGRTRINKYINISETEEVLIVKEIFREDLDEKHVFIDYECEKKINLHDEHLSDELNQIMEKFNEAMITSDERCMSYCRVHSLDIKRTSFDDLFRILYPGKIYEVVNGGFKVYDIENEE